jgi:hypothetical protein
MKSVYLLALVMFLGIGLMFYSSYHLAGAIRQAPDKGPGSAGNKGSLSGNSDVQLYVLASYTGLTLFVIGGAGGLIVAFRAIAHRF